MAGHNSYGGADWDFYIVKLNSSGTFQWNKTFGGTNTEYATSIIQTTDGGYAVAGYTMSYGAGQRDFYVLKLNNSGNFQWSKTIGGTNYDEASSIVQTTDGGYVIAGRTQSFGANGDMYIVKLDANGNLQWNKTIGGTSYDFGCSIIQTTGGGYAVCGYTISFGTTGGFNFYIAKLDAGGNLLWSCTIGGSTGAGLNSIIQTADGGYAVAGVIQSFGAGGYDMYIVKIDSVGMLQWRRTLGGTGDDGAFGGSTIIQTTDGGYTVVGDTRSFGAGGSDIYIVKLNGSGTLQWSKTVGGTGYEDASSIIRTTDGGYVAAGRTNSFGAGNYDFYIVKFDSSWNTCGNIFSPSSISGTGGNLVSQASLTSSPIPLTSSPTPTTLTLGTLTIICTFVDIHPIYNEIPSQFSLSQNYPNPFNPTTHFEFQIASFGLVKLTIYDILGREIATLVNDQLQPGTYEVAWDASNYPSGVYYYKLKADDFSETKKMILMK